MMENVKRSIAVLLIFAISMVFMHISKAPQRVIRNEIPTVCLPTQLAQKLGADAQLKWDAQIAYDTVERDGDVSSYRCYLSFPQTDVVCAPRNVANRKDLHECPMFPSIVGTNRTCYFLNKKHYPLQKRLETSTPHMSIRDLQGTPVKDIATAKKMLAKKR